MNVRLEYDMRWRAGIWFEDRLQINDYTAELAITTNTTDQIDHVIALSRINHFVYHELMDTVFVREDDTAQIQALITAGIKVTTLPSDPIDQVIGIALYCKLNSILEQRMIVTGVTMQSDLGDNVRYLHNEIESLGPLAQTGWWTDTSPKHCNFKSSASKRNVVRMHRSASWRDLDLEWGSTPRAESEIDSNTVVFAKFTPDEN